jgi:aspartate racemase
MARSRSVGVLGGMGPYATVAFFQKLVTLTPAARDWDHLRIVVDDNPHIPSRSRHVLYGEESPLAAMLESCLKLQAYPVDFIAIPCNSAAVFVPDLQRRLSVPVLNICEVSANALAVAYPAVRRVSALGSAVTYCRRSYEEFLAAHGVELVVHSEEIQREIERQIERLKLGAADASDVVAMQAVIERLRREYGTEAAIMACTEFGCLPGFDAGIPAVDSSLELARHTVSLARSTAATPE